jgi:hypothetical protein
VFVGPEALNPCKTVVEHSRTWGGQAATLFPILGTATAGVTYWLGYRQKERERRFGFYKERVLDPSTTEIDDFFEKYRSKLIEHAKRTAGSSGEGVVPRASTKLYREFSSDLYDMKDKIVTRLEVYDEKAGGSLVEAVEVFDTKVTQRLISGVSREEETVKEILLDARRSMTKTIYNCNLKLLKK